MKNERLSYLLEREQTGTATPQELSELSNWYHDLNLSSATGTHWEGEEERLLADFRSKTAVKRRPMYRSLVFRYSAAAAILIFIAAGFWFFRAEQVPQPMSAEVVEKENNIAPGGNKAYLTLADGSRIALDDRPDGELASLSGVRIIKAKDGQLIYEINEQSASADQVLHYNTIETPRGGQFQVVLPDGSHVWLNAASSLKYPTSFKGDERRVELEGEAYFEIAHNRTKPFRVVGGQQTVEVLGTHFNVNSYTDEASTITTLLEGSVRVRGQKGVEEIIKPGQQSELSSSGSIRVKDTDTDLAVAWKDGRFVFRNESLESVMRKISRWYDVEVSYPAGVPQKTVWGNISRAENVSEILELIELSKIAHFKIVSGADGGKGRRIIVMK